MKYHKLLFALTLTLLSAGAMGASCSGGPSGPNRPLEPGPNFGVSLPAWNHSGTAISYSRIFDSTLTPNPGFYLMNSEGEHLDIYPIFGTLHRWFPGDTEFVYNTGGALGGELLIYNINTKETRTTGIQTYAPPFDLSRDGQFVYYVDKSNNEIWPTTIYEQRLGDTARRSIADGNFPSISTDGRILAYRRRELYLSELETSFERKLSNVGYPHGWSSSSQELVVTDDGDLFVLSTSGQLRRLIDGRNAAHISPTNNRVVFERRREDLSSDLWIIDINGRGLKRLVP